MLILSKPLMAGKNCRTRKRSLLKNAELHERTATWRLDTCFVYKQSLVHPADILSFSDSLEVFISGFTECFSRQSSHTFSNKTAVYAPISIIFCACRPPSFRNRMPSHKAMKILVPHAHAQLDATLQIGECLQLMRPHKWLPSSCL